MVFNFNNTSIGTIFKARRSGFGVGTLAFMLLFGVIFIGVSFVFIRDDLRSLGWMAVEGTVAEVAQSTDSEGDTMYRPTISYSVDGQTYSVTTDYSSSQSYDVGSRQTIHYNPETPSDGVLRTNGIGYFIYLFPIVGFSVIIGAIIGFIRDRRRTGQINQLKRSGTKIQGVITDVQSTSGSNGRSNSSQITVSATDGSGRVRHFVSDSMSGLGIVGLADYQTKPVAIDVYLDPTNPEAYYVDLDDIPEISPERITDLLQMATNDSRSEHESKNNVTPNSGSTL